MPFGRKKPLTMMEQLRKWLWPGRNWSRSARYFIRRLERLRASPHQVALGCAAGVFASITPLLGTQMLLAVLLAVLIRANVPAALIGTFFGNPISWPLIWGSTYMAGCHMLGIESILGTADLEHAFAPLKAAIATASPDLFGAAVDTLWPVFKPMLVGSIPLGLMTAAIIYYLLRPAVTAYQRSRASHLAAPSRT